MRRFPGTTLALAALVAGAIFVLASEDEVRDARFGGAGPAAPAGTARVLRVIDGDTIEVRFRGTSERVRYIGVDTPESVAPGQPVECFGRAASAVNRRLVEGRRVRLRFDSELRDRYGRLLAYVYAGDRFVNAELVRRGAATSLTIAPNDTRARFFAGLERRARAARRGLWGRCPRD